MRRIAVGRFVEAPVPDRYDNDTLIVSVVEEVPVVVKRLRVVEELHIRKRTRATRRPQRVTVRRQQAIVEREPRDASASRPRT